MGNASEVDDPRTLAAWRARAAGGPVLLLVLAEPGVLSVPVLAEVGDFVIHEAVRPDGWTAPEPPYLEVEDDPASDRFVLSHGPTGRRLWDHHDVEGLEYLAAQLAELPRFERHADAPDLLGTIIETWRFQRFGWPSVRP